MDRMFMIMKDTGTSIDLTWDLRQLLYLSNAVEQERVNQEKRNRAQQQRSSR